MISRLRFLPFALLAAVAPTAAQNGSSFSAADAPFSPSVAYSTPDFRCEDLVSWTDHDVSILTARTVEASAAAPKACRIEGVLPPEIVFEVNLPAEWNGRLYMHGNGGYAGTPPDAPNRQAVRDRALAEGFATVYTNTGHDRRTEPGGTFAFNRTDKLVDYAFRAVHLSVATAKDLAARYYGGPVRYSYWDGCSTGGRQGLMSAQRFPEDFDGIIAGAPVLDFSGTMMSYVWKLQALDGAGLTQAKMDLVAERVYDRCDALDGVEDGLIEDPRACFFDPSFELPLCAGDEADDCFTARQIEALTKIYSDVEAGGERLYPAQPVSAEVADAGGRRGWDNWILRDNGPSTGEVFSQEFFRYLAFPEDDPDRTWRDIDLEGIRERTAAIHAILDATNPDLSAFERSGGKMLMHFGWADTALNPLRAIEYYEEAVETNGPDTRDFFRFYLVPGMFHCRGGVGADDFDLMTPLIEWVEKDRAPEEIEASHAEGGEVKFTRKLCPYPEVAKYDGQGDPDSAASFTCQAP